MHWVLRSCVLSTAVTDEMTSGARCSQETKLMLVTMLAVGKGSTPLCNLHYILLQRIPPTSTPFPFIYR